MNIHILTSKHPLTHGHGGFMNVGLWTCQVILAVIFCMAGYMKAFTSMESLAMSMPWTEDVPMMLVRFIGICELAGAIGILLPDLTGIKPRLTPMAGIGLTTLMFLALIFHVSRGEYMYVLPPVILGAMAYFVAWGRAFKEPLDEAQERRL
jgi:putative oxidoreductase